MGERTTFGFPRLRFSVNFGPKMGNLCCSMFASHATMDEPLGKGGNVPATSNLVVMVGMDKVLRDNEDLGMQELDEKRGR